MSAKDSEKTGCEAEEIVSPPPAPSGGPPAAGERREGMREYFLGRFASWLDGILADETPPEGIAAEILAELEGAADVGETAALDGRCDMRALWSAVTALAEEVRLEGRAFKELSRRLELAGDLGSRTEEALRAHGEALAEARRVADEALQARRERESEALREAERRGSKELVELLVDLRDRLERGLRLAREHLRAPVRVRGASWLGRVLRRGARPTGSSLEAVAALEKGYAMTLDRLEESLERLGVREIQCAGRPLDPRLMNAAEVEETSRVPEGTVVEVYRTGYRWNDEILRTAQVKVARPPREEREPLSDLARARDPSSETTPGTDVEVGA